MKEWEVDVETHTNPGTVWRSRILKDVFKAHRRICKTGTAKEIKRITKLALKLSRDYSKEFFGFGWVEEDEEDEKQKPGNGQPVH